MNEELGPQPAPEELLAVDIGAIRAAYKAQHPDVVGDEERPAPVFGPLPNQVSGGQAPDLNNLAPFESQVKNHQDTPESSSQ